MAKFYPPSITAAVRNRIALSAGEIVYDTTNKCGEVQLLRMAGKIRKAGPRRDTLAS